MYRFIIVIFLFLALNSNAQELNCKINVDSQAIGISNKQVFVTLQNAILEYMNNTKWTNTTYKDQEKINCSITINILQNPSTNQYKGSLQLLVSRQVYNANYQTPILSFNDKDISFNYEEYEPLIYNENSFDSNLVSILTFYAYTIIGFREDTFSFKGGENSFEQAENVVNQAQQSGGAGWKKTDGNNTRYQLNENLLSPVYEPFRSVMYNYHLHGLDKMIEDDRQAKETISKYIIGLQKLFNERPNTFLIRVFMDTKSDEIVDIFSDGPRIETTKFREVLSKIFPSFNSKWEKIKI
ncbi:MAG: DUF4835 family protein [Flavobacteriaceae bacterium]|nr:DUF4835 family protein [Flavobacteriaceae bacterium]